MASIHFYAATWQESSLQTAFVLLTIWIHNILHKSLKQLILYNMLRMQLFTFHCDSMNIGKWLCFVVPFWYDHFFWKIPHKSLMLSWQAEMYTMLLKESHNIKDSLPASFATLIYSFKIVWWASSGKMGNSEGRV
jgi:hypothetical protein